MSNKKINTRRKRRLPSTDIKTTSEPPIKRRRMDTSQTIKENEPKCETSKTVKQPIAISITSSIKQSLASTSRIAQSAKEKYEVAVTGYIRSNFPKDCWINDIIRIILEYYLQKCGSLYMCGSGNAGKLGIKEYENKLCKELTVCPPFNDMNALDVSAGVDHILILDIDGQVWSSGLGDYGQLGIEELPSAATPQKITLVQPVIQVAAGCSHSLILLNSGYVQSFGEGAKGKLGHGNDENVLTPQTIESLTNHKIIQIAAGCDSSACLSETGVLFCFGNNRTGQCGVGHERGKCIVVPTKIEFAKKIIFVKSGYNHSFFITGDHLVYSFGCNQRGQLGLGHKNDEYSPALVEELSEQNIAKCAAGDWHSIFLSKEGVVWSFGSNYEGQCGLSSDIDEQLTPKVIDFFVSNKIKAVGCYAGDHQSAVISEDGFCYVFGCNDSYELGLEERKYYYTPSKLSLPQNMSVQKISMGEQYSAMICS